MAKKKTTIEGGATPARKRTAKSRKPPAPAVGQAPLIDTNLAAEAAARMLAAKAKLHVDPNQVSNAEAGKESAAFQQLKQSLNRPPAHTVTSALGSAFGEHKSNLPTPDRNQVAHNQTTGGVGRVNVPRRTAG